MRVVVVDDEKKMRDEIADYLKTFEKEQKVSVIAQVYESPEDFLEHYQKDADLILLDVEMPGMDGISLARRIRQDDKEVLLMFITNMAQTVCPAWLRGRGNRLCHQAAGLSGVCPQDEKGNALYGAA